jgi:Calcineurin-like phosphoesterase
MENQKNLVSRRSVLVGGLAGLIAATLITEDAVAAGITFSHILGRPTKTSAALSLVASGLAEVYVEYGTSKTKFTAKTEVRSLTTKEPQVFELASLAASSKIYYRLRYKTSGSATFIAGNVLSFSTAKSLGKPFSFTVQGDTHPERAGKMFNAELYTVAMKNIVAQQPDFHILLGDDFSIDPLIGKNQASQVNIDKVYSTHRDWLAISGGSVPIYLVNGNHEQAAQYLLDGTASNPAVLAGQSRLKYFPLPINDGFYSTDAKEVEFVGNPRDYYSWTWGDATFVTLDPYWHSKSAVDNAAGVSNDQSQTNKKAGGASGKTADLWQVGLGDEQYFWLKTVLETSKSKYIFVFAHHVMGTGRGAVEVSYNYEWGGKDPGNKTTFKEQRPNWDLPIHDLMVKHGVSIFFQGHDHIFVTQTRDGLIYQSMPNPADDTFSMFNADAYKTGTKAANSGHVRVSVGATAAKVEYFLAARPQDTKRKNRSIAHSYSVKPRAGF